MGAGQNAAITLHFAGPPERLEALTPIGVHRARGRAEFPVLALEIPTEPGATVRHVLQFEPVAPKATWLRLSLPQATAPGSYRGKVHVDGECHEAVVDV